MYYMNKYTLLGFLLLLTLYPLFPAEDTASFSILLQNQDNYKRHPRLQEEDSRNNRVFQFTQGLEVITDINNVKVFISGEEKGRTPFESDDLSIGYYRIKLEKTGYPDKEFRILVTKGKRTTVEVLFNTDKESDDTSATPPTLRIYQGTTYPSFNPDDPLYYRRIIVSKSLFQTSSPDIIITDSENIPLITLLPDKETELDYIYSWDGYDVDETPSGEGKFSFYGVSDFSINSTFEVDRRFSRKVGCHFSGYSGLSLVPFGQLLFPGSFQFGSFISYDFEGLDTGRSANLPFSFFLRFSPLTGWEASIDLEVTMFPDSGTPQVKAGTSQKILILDNLPFIFSLDGRYSYRTKINDLSAIEYNNMIRDPAGSALAFPVQFKVKLWDFYIAPEILYSFHPLVLTNTSTEGDLTGVFRWGVSYTDRFFQAGFSSALFTQSLQNSPMLRQTGLDFTFYMPRSPLYISINFVHQEILERSRDIFLGLGIGFLL